jgi:hypothetical protein
LINRQLISRRSTIDTGTRAAIFLLLNITRAPLVMYRRLRCSTWLAAHKKKVTGDLLPAF